jgi:N utilization substance protein B
MVRPETKARARALQLLYAWDLSGHPSIDTVVTRVAKSFGGLPDGYDRSAELAARAVAGQEEYDAQLARASEHWRLERVGVIERNILRLAMAELDEGTTPPRVVLDEAVKLAHWFGGGRSPGFVNGVLDAVARESGRL